MSISDDARSNLLTALTLVDPVAETNVDLYADLIDAGLATTDANKTVANQYWDYLESLRS